MQQRVDLADLGETETATRGATPTEGGRKSEVHVYVLEVTIHGEYGWTSVHTTYEGARARLEEKIDEYDVRGEYDVQLAAEVSGETSTAAGDEGDAVVYGISRLPVETP